MKVEIAEKLLRKALQHTRNFPVEGDRESILRYAYQAGWLSGEIEKYFEVRDFQSETDLLKDYVDSIKQDKSRELENDRPKKGKEM
jgi:hypothetical protein